MCLYMTVLMYNAAAKRLWHAEAAEPGGHWGQMPLHFLYLGKKCPFSGMKGPYFHRIEVPFLQNLSALFGQCLLTFKVLPRPLVARSVKNTKYKLSVAFYCRKESAVFFVANAFLFLHLLVLFSVADILPTASVILYFMISDKTSGDKIL